MVIKSSLVAIKTIIISLVFNLSNVALAADYRLVDLGSLGNGSAAYDVNSDRMVVGQSGDLYGRTRAFFWDDINGIQDLGAFSRDSGASGINDSNQVSGSSDRRAFLWDSINGMQDLGTLGGTSSGASGINASGQIVGSSTISGDSEQHVFLWDSTNGMQDLGTLGGTSATGNDINAGGQIVGAGHTLGNAAWHAFIWDSTNGMQDLGSLGGHSYASAINDTGQVVGYSYLLNSSDRHAYIWDSVNGMQDLGTLGTGSSSFAGDINNHGQVVGSSQIDPSTTPNHAFIWDSINGMRDLCVLTDCNAAGWANLAVAFAINDNGDIVGMGITKDAVNGESHAFLAIKIKPINIDIKPSKKPENVIDLKKDKNLKVAIVGDEIFDALQVDPATLKFDSNKASPASPVRFKGQDYNRDGFPDLILTFKLKETGIACGDNEATLTGETYGGEIIEGSDNFIVEPCP